MSLKLRLLAIVAGIVLAGLVVETAIILHNARHASVDEIEANLEFSRDLVAFLSADRSRSLSHADIERLSQTFQDLRHVRVGLRTAGGDWVPLTGTETARRAPAWFERLILPADQAFDDVDIRGWGDTDIRIRATARDEVAEVWREVSQLFLLELMLMALICGLVYIGVWGGLAPIRELHNGFQRLERNDFDVRLRGAAVPELAETRDRFNHLAGVLQQSVAERRALSRRLVRAQEQERRLIARELHDEMGPHLFGLRSELSNFLWSAKAGDTADAAGRAQSMQTGLERLQQQIRGLLGRLRPPVLDDLGLADSLAALIDDWRRRQPAVDWHMPRYEVDAGLDDVVRVTVYRAVQECLTNIARHAGALRATVRLWTDHGPQPVLHLVIADDGRGSAVAVTPGLGLSGLRERVAALDGEFELVDSADGGLTVRLRIPLESDATDPRLA